MVLLLDIGQVLSCSINKLALAHLLAMTVDYHVHLTIWENESAFAMLIAFLPTSFKPLAIRVENSASSITFIVFEVAFVYLPIWPEEATLALLFAVDERSFIYSAIRPVIKSFTIHRVLAEHSLVHFAITVDATTVSMSFAILPIAFVKRLPIKYFDALPIWSLLVLLHFAFINGTTWSTFPKVLKDS